MTTNDMSIRGKTIYVLNFPGENDKSFYDINANRDEICKPFIYFRKEIEKSGYQFKVTKDCSRLNDVAAVVSLNNIDQTIINNLSRFPKNKCFLVVHEPPVVQPYMYNPGLKKIFGTIFTMFDDLVDDRSYYKFYHYQTRDKITEDIVDFSEKKLCIMVQTNHTKYKHRNELYTERFQIAQFLTNKGELDLYGRNWEAISSSIGLLNEDKQTVFRKYKFCICYENMRNQQGYITERFFEALYGGCVPIYWGADNMTDYVPKECFVDRLGFSSNDELYDFMKSMDRKTYEAYLSAAQRYSKSPQATCFSPSGFGESILKILRTKIFV